MTAYAGALRRELAAHWDLVLEHGLWASSSPRAADLVPGDVVFVWRPRTGWVGECLVTDAPRHTSVRPAPWTDRRDATWTVSVDVVRRRSSGDGRCPGGYEPVTGLHSTRLWHLPVLDADHVQDLRAHLTDGVVGPAHDR